VTNLPGSSQAVEGPTPAYWTPSQLAEQLQVSVQSIYRWAKEDASMPQIRLGKGRGSTLRFPRDRVLRWLRSREGVPAEPPSLQLMRSGRQVRGSTSKASSQEKPCAN
jgi:excisionase family DNA binding protein